MLRRRTLLQGALTTLTLLAGVASCGLAGQNQDGAGAAQAHEAAVGISTKESVLQVVAHADDDLYFMNPDLGQSIRSGRPVTTVFFTSGEADGVNAGGNEARLAKAQHQANKPKFAAARQNGVRAAYAKMATGDRTSTWKRESIRTTSGIPAELNTLADAPQIRLIWLQLHEAGAIRGERPHSLHGLWTGQVPTLGSMRPQGSPVKADFSYTKEQLICTLTGILNATRPTFVRLQDPTPDTDGKGETTDHQDHTYGARFAQAALAAYARQEGIPPVATQAYLGYQNGRLPHSLGPAALRAKLDTLETYGWTDGYDCGDPAGCGDRKVGAQPLENGWAQSTRYRRGESTNWLQSGPGGTLRAFGVLNGRLAVWSADAKGTWTGPKLLPGDGIESGVRAARLRDGRLAVVATRTVLGTQSTDYRREVVITQQNKPGGEFTPWKSLDAPVMTHRESWQLGTPHVSSDGAGNVTIFVRDAQHGVSARTLGRDGKWRPWTALGGQWILDALATAVDSQGRAHVYAATPRTVLGWSQTTPGGPFGPPLHTGLPATTGPIDAQADGKDVRVFFREPDSAQILTVTIGGPTRPTRLGDEGGFGPIALATDQSSALLLTRNDHGTVSSTVLQATARPTWESTRFLFGGAPAGTTLAPDRGVAAAMGLDGRLYWAVTEDGKLGPWRDAH